MSEIKVSAILPLKALAKKTSLPPLGSVDRGHSLAVAA